MDQPMHPVDRAVWWMEYLIRHPNSEDTMRSPGAEISWWQYFLIDVFTFLVIISVAFLTIIKLLIKFCCCRKRHGGKSKKD